MEGDGHSSMLARCGGDVQATIGTGQEEQEEVVKERHLCQPDVEVGSCNMKLRNP